MTAPPRPLFTRAALSVALMVGFYAFAIAIAAAVAWIPYGIYLVSDRVQFELLSLCVATAIGILWAILPTRDRFTPPGPELTDVNAPRLLGLIREIARDTEQAPPAEVFLLNEVNAYVTHRGGVMGFGGRRVMGVGLPLVTEFSRAELRAVLTHEFGHYVAGDVTLGPWIYKTRAAIGRAVAATADGLIEAPFQWYARLFLRTTQAISREQEFQADCVSARVAGSRAAQDALRKAAILGPAHALYLQQDVWPVIGAGHLPPITEGFRQFLDAPDTTALTSAVRDHALGAIVEECDSHPPLSERLQALETMPATTAFSDGGSDGPLLDPEAHVHEWIAFTIGAPRFVALTPVAWEEVAARVHQPMWATILQQHRSTLAALRAEQMPIGRDAHGLLGASITGAEQAAELGSEACETIAAQTMAIALADMLTRAGWVPRSSPGRAMTLRRDGLVVELRETLMRLADGAESRESWEARCREFGIAGMPLVADEAVTAPH